MSFSSISSILRGSKKLFWSSKEDDHCPGKKDDQKEDELFDQFGFHKFSFQGRSSEKEMTFFYTRLG